MPSCEKCWGDAYLKMMLNQDKSQTEYYSMLIEERKANPCTPEQQAGQDAEECPKCKRNTIHVIIKYCTNCSYKQS